MKDDMGEEVIAGDWISFTYGIPPTRVDARIGEREGELWLTVLGRHKPRTMPLRELRYHVGSWHKSDGPRGVT